MRVALLHPSYWPEVRRGSERLVHDLAVCHAATGNEPVVITSHPARRRVVAVEDDVEVIRCPRPPRALVQRRHREDYLGQAPFVMAELLRGGFDVAHAFFNVDARAAVAAKRVGGPPVVYSQNGIPVRKWLVGRRGRLSLTLAAVSRADACSVLSRVAADSFRRYLLREPEILPGGVFCDRFALDASRARVPTLVFAADPADPRKRFDLLTRAFARFRAKYPRARLLVAGRAAGAMARPAAGAGVEFVDADRHSELARAYAEAWASVLPSVHEGFGLVVVESLAAGTPVLAARSGALPEIIDDPAVGRLFAPDDEDALLAALEHALESPPDAAVVDACRAHARRWDWGAVFPAYERVERAAAEAGA